ncbi:MAG: peptidoglycan bridge formation glycyltransferase FemA/FemB family protein [Candidatus Absconditabacterales bacterium]|nr:peptidoglycan bridge formation glycyltransferase FemA/FemB family protein [Candidatus Absconditabacterales bacterium]
MLWQSEQRANILNKKGTLLTYHGYIGEKKSLGWGLTGGFFVGVSPDCNVSKNDLTARAASHGLDYIQWETYSLTNHHRPILSLVPGVYKSILPCHTAFIDLTQGLDHIWDSCKQKGRYGVNYARTHDVKIRFSQDHADIQAFYTLLKETAQRDGFFINPYEHYHLIVTCTDAILVLAYHDDTLLAGSILITDQGITRYYYGASTSGPKKNLMASYLVQREGITYAHHRGSHTYDFLGVAPPDDPTHPLVGVTIFKQKFAPQIVRCSYAYHHHQSWKSLVLMKLKTIKAHLTKTFSSKKK